jgi:hypothetical protein
MHNVFNKISFNHFAKNTEDENEEQKNLKLYGELIERVHVRIKISNKIIQDFIYLFISLLHVLLLNLIEIIFNFNLR